MKRWLFVFVLFSCSRFAWAFPELVRHGYTQCTACHVSPTGGGVLNKYGRELAGELLSTWSSENESQFLHSKVGKDLADKGLLFGGDIRQIQIYSHTPQGDMSKLFMMMANLQTAYQTGNFTGVVSIGQVTQPEDHGGLQGNFNSTEYYGLVKFTDEIHVRAGRFDPAFGINLPDHTVVTRQMLGFMPTFQMDTVEAGYMSDHWTVLASAARARPQIRIGRQESVRALTVDYAFLERMKAGASYWSGTGPQQNRTMAGGHAILGITKEFYNMTELDFEYQSKQNGTYGFTQFGYEAYKGVTPYLQYQHEQPNQKDSTTLAQYYGAGAHFYPRPHFELSGEWDRIKATTGWSDGAYLLGHYYF